MWLGVSGVTQRELLPLPRLEVFDDDLRIHRDDVGRDLARGNEVQGVERINQFRRELCAAQVVQACEIDLGEQPLTSKGLVHGALQLVQARREKAAPAIALGWGPAMVGLRKKGGRGIAGLKNVRPAGAVPPNPSACDRPLRRLPRGACKLPGGQ
ncbi:hypothetical protein D9M69_593140 [compost metagenome]